MIPSRGRVLFGEAIATGIGGNIVVGVGESEPSEDDTELGFEVIRVPIRNAVYDVESSTVIYSGTIPEDYAINITEVGVVSVDATADSNNMITTFESAFEDWSAGTWVTDNVRVGEEGLRLSGATAVSDSGMRVSLEEAISADRIAVALHGSGGDVEIRLNNTEQDYMTMTFPVGTGYKVHTVRVGDLTRVGDGDVASTSFITVIHSGSGSVTMDAIRLNSSTGDGVLAVRQRFPQMYSKVVGMPLDIDIPVEVEL